MRSFILRVRAQVAFIPLLLPFFLLTINTPKCFSFHFSSSATVRNIIRNTQTRATISNTHSENWISLPHQSTNLFINPDSSGGAHDRCARPLLPILPTTNMRTWNRRDALSSLVTAASIAYSIPLSISDANAYTPDSDQLRESLYLISRVQEATVQQERLVTNTRMQEDLQRKMNLSLRLVDRSYRVLDQITYCSKFIAPDDIVEATAAGFEAADSLQEAIDYVATGLGSGPLTEKQKRSLTEALTTTRQELFKFLKYVPSDKLQEARLRVEKENIDNREEFDGDANAGVYNPVILPWKTQ